MEFFDRLREALAQLAGVLPPLFFAFVILLAGYLVARAVERLVDAVLDRLQFDRSAERWGVTEAVERTGTREKPTRLVGKLLFWLVMLMVILLAAAVLRVENVNEVFANLVGYIPVIFAAIIVIVFGILLGEFVRALILASAGGVAGVPTLAKVAKVIVITISVFMALTQLGVAADIVTTAFTLILGAVALAVALAFGLGNTKLAGEITRRWYEAGRTSAEQQDLFEKAPSAAAEPGPERPSSPPSGEADRN